MISVHDTGPGISRDNLGHLFKPFFSTKSRGGGFDLAVAKRIMEAHGGAIEAESPPGDGAVFRLKFPLEKRRAIRTGPIDD